MFVRQRVPHAVFGQLSVLFQRRSVSAGIVGLPNVGKSLLFNALSRANVPSENYPFCTIEPHEAVVAVPDANVAALAAVVKPEKTINSIVKIIDIAGIVKGASEGAGLGNKFLSHIRAVDAILHCVRCFSDKEIIHVAGKVNPLEDIDVINTELILADIQHIEKTMTKNKKLKERPTYEKVHALLMKGTPPRGAAVKGWEAADLAVLRTMQLISAKPMLYIANVGEDDVAGASKTVAMVRERAAQEGSGCLVVCAKLEADVSLMEDAERVAFLESIGQKDTALPTVTRGAYDLLGLQSFYTAGVKEVRAWTVPKGSTARKGAGAIHSDLEATFVRAEIYKVADLVTHGSEAAVRKAGLVRTEGERYVLQPTDVCHFLCSR